MKSGKQRRGEIKRARATRGAKRRAMAKAHEFEHAPYRFVPVNESLLAPYNSYGAPDFVTRGYYVDMPFRCKDCGKEEVWTGTQQKWWYEIAKGYVYSTAVRCRACRRKERSRRDEARRVHLAGIERKRRSKA
jgi:hypothetical protein